MIDATDTTSQELRRGIFGLIGVTDAEDIKKGGKALN